MATRKYRVDIVPRAQQDLASIRARIARDRPGAAVKWLQGARRHASLPHLFAKPLRDHPEIADEDFPFEYRHILFGNYRIVYRLVAPGHVLVVRVIHASQLLTRAMLQDEPP